MSRPRRRPLPPWTAARSNQLRRAVLKGQSLTSIARDLHTTYWDAKVKCAQLGLRPALHNTGGPASADRWHRVDALTTRCRCGLLLPCYDCLRTIYAYASARPGGGWVEIPG